MFGVRCLKAFGSSTRLKLSEHVPFPVSRNIPQWLTNRTNSDGNIDVLDWINVRDDDSVPEWARDDSRMGKSAWWDVYRVLFTRQNESVREAAEPVETVWEILQEYAPESEPPEVENVIVLERTRVGDMERVKRLRVEYYWPDELPRNHVMVVSNVQTYQEYMRSRQRGNGSLMMEQDINSIIEKQLTEQEEEVFVGLYNETGEEVLASVVEITERL